MLQWKAGGLSYEKRTQLLTVCISFDIDVLIILEANVTSTILNGHHLGKIISESYRKEDKLLETS